MGSWRTHNNHRARRVAAPAIKLIGRDGKVISCHFFPNAYWRARRDWRERVAKAAEDTRNV